MSFNTNFSSNFSSNRFLNTIRNIKSSRIFPRTVVDSIASGFLLKNAGAGFLGYIVFLLYLECNPKIMNIWYRTNEHGQKSFLFDGIVKMTKLPFTRTYYWKCENLDLNWTVYSASSIALYNLGRMLL